MVCCPCVRDINVRPDGLSSDASSMALSKAGDRGMAAERMHVSYMPEVCDLRGPHGNAEGT